MKNLLCVCVLILCGEVSVLNAMASQTNSVTNVDKVRLYIGKDPRPINDGYVVYEVDTDRYAKLPNWFPDNFTNPPPLSVSSAIHVAKTEMVKMYDTSKYRLVLQGIDLVKTVQKEKTAWYYVVNYQGDLNEILAVRNLDERMVASVVVLMDGGVVEPIPIDMSNEIRLQGSNVMIDPDVILNDRE